MDELSIFLQHAIIGGLIEEAGHQRNNRDPFLQQAAYHVEKLAEELKNHMHIKIGEQPQDLR